MPHSRLVRLRQAPALLRAAGSSCPTPRADTALPLALPVQWVEKFSSSSDTIAGPARVLGPRGLRASVQPGTPVQIFPSGQLATVAQVLDHARRATDVGAGTSAGIILDREVDVSRGDWIVAAPVPATAAEDDFRHPRRRQPAWPGQRELRATVAWMDDEPLVAGRVYWALHGHRWVKAKVQPRGAQASTSTPWPKKTPRQLEPNAIGHVELLLQEPCPLPPLRARACWAR